MIPHSLVGRTSYRAYGTFSLLVLMVLFFVWEMVLTAQAAQPIEALVPAYAFVTCEVGRAGVFEIVADGVRGTFIHLSFASLLMNLAYLWIFAPRLEEFLSSRRFLSFFFLGALGGYVASWLMLRGDCVAVVGPSAAIAGVMGGFVFLFPARPVDVFVPLFSRRYTLPAFFFLLMYFAYQLFASQGGPLSGVVAPFWDEVGGFITGFVAMFIITLFKPAPSASMLDD